MDPHRIQIFDGADNHTISLAIRHNFHLKLLPAQQRFFDEYLAVQAGCQSPAHNVRKLLRRVSNAAASAAQGEAGAYDERPAPDGAGYGFCFLQGVCRPGAGHGKPESVHGFFEKLSVLSAANGCCRRTDELHVVAFQYAAFLQLHGQIESRLSAKCR